MSFSTRSGRSIEDVPGRGMAPQTQVTYHQVPPRPISQQFVPSQQQQSSGYQSQPQQQAQQPSAMAQQQQQQQHQQQQQQQKFKMQQQPPPSTPQTPQTPQQPPVQPKVEPTTPLKPTVPQVQPPQPIQQQETPTGEGVENPTKPWRKVKNPTFKVNKVQKRRRQNARFRKLLIPKNAIMVLNELQPGIVFDAEEQTNAFNQATYVVRLEIEGQVYSGEGPSKGAAKAAAAESAVKGLILKKIAESNCKKEPSTPGINAENEEQSMDTGSGDDASDKGSINGRRVIPEDEVPWGSLASFALFKLFADWKAQGSSFAPAIAPSLSAPKPVPKPVVPRPAGQSGKPLIPENPETIHPVTLVGRLHPGNVFSELNRDGNPPNLTFTIGITINGVQYTGTARSKKEAKKACAISALKALGVPYNTNN